MCDQQDLSVEGQQLSSPAEKAWQKTCIYQITDWIQEGENVTATFPFTVQTINTFNIFLTHTNRLALMYTVKHCPQNRLHMP